MGGSITKEVENITNQTVNEAVNNMLLSTSSDQRDTVESTISQVISLGNLDCQNIDIGNIDQTVKMSYVTNLTSENISNLATTLATTLSNNMSQSQNIKRAMGSEWGTLDADEVETALNNIIQNIVQNTVTEKTVNQQVAFTYGSINQHILTGNIVCENLNAFNINVLIESQTKELSSSLTQALLNNNLSQKILNDANQTQDIEKSGIASILAGIMLPIIIIGGIAVIIFVFGFKETISKVLNWKFILVVSLIIAAYFTIAYFVKIWPWHRYYSIQIGADGFRTNQCERNDNSGTFTSMDSCKKEINNPNSLWYYNKFWGFDSDQNKCLRYTQAFVAPATGSTGRGIYASYNDQATCETDSAPANVYYFNKTVGDFSAGWTGPTGGNIPFMCPNNNTTYSCQVMQTTDKNAADYPVPNYSTLEECNSNLNNSNIYYVPYCNTESICGATGANYNDSCQYLLQVPQVSPYNAGGQQGSSKAYQTQEDICCLPSTARDLS